MWASLNGHVEVVDKLLQHGATVDLQKLVCKYIATPQISLPSILCFSVLLPLCVLSEWGKFTDVGISQWTCGGGGQVITTRSHSRPATSGNYDHTHLCISGNEVILSCTYHHS